MLQPNKKLKIDPLNEELAIVRESKKSLEQTFRTFHAGPEGLKENQASARLERIGNNELAHHSPVTLFLLHFLHAFHNPFIYLLLSLALVSFYLDFILPILQHKPAHLISTIIIIVMILLSALFRFAQEFRSHRTMESLSAMIDTTITVIRRRENRLHGKKRQIPIKELVPGDIVKLSAGDMIPADLRLVESRDLYISQAVLTGESIPVGKYDIIGDHDSLSSTRILESVPSSDEPSALDLPNCLFMGTSVVSGYATAIVVATGKETYFGSLSQSLVTHQTESSFDRGVNSVSWLLIRFMVVLIPIVFLINGLTKGEPLSAFMFAVAVAVGLTPEMLPMIVNANLAKGAMAMAERKVVVKRLSAIQNLGAMDLLCTDKTGTLTQDRIILERHLDLNDENCDHILQLAWLNSYHQSGILNVMDRAILQFAQAYDQFTPPEEWHKIDEIPFDFMRRRLSTIVERKEEHLLICKGAVEEILSLTKYIREGETVLPFDDHYRQRIIEMADKRNRDGFRVLLLATRTFTDTDRKQYYSATDESDLILEGMLTFLDPPKDSSRQALTALRENNVAIKILTGDNATVTAKICNDLGIDTGRALLGDEIDQYDDLALRKYAETHTIFAKLTPPQKARIIEALQANGHVVGFLGDGINDAPALKQSDVGISVDTGTDIAKESADIILLEKDLTVLEEGVIKGREIFGNILKYLNITASSNFGNVFSVLIASAFLPFLPMLPIHLLIQNLLYDLSQLAMPWDRVDREFLKEPRRWNAKNIGRFMLWMGPISSIFDLITFAVMWNIFSANQLTNQSLFQSGWFVVGLLSQVMIVHILRTRKIPFIESTATFPVIVMTLLIMGIGLMLPFSTLGAMIGLTALPLPYFAWLAGILISYAIVAHLVKRLYIHRYGEWY